MAESLGCCERLVCGLAIDMQHSSAAEDEIGPFLHIADAGMLERTLRLRTPELVCRYFNPTEAICFFAYVGHR